MGSVNDFFHKLPDDLCADTSRSLNSPFVVQVTDLGRTAFEHFKENLLSNSIIQSHFNGGGVGKMFGLLLVRSESGELGYLAAFSGKIGETNHVLGFVPPVYDNLQEAGFFKVGEQELNELNAKIEDLSNSDELVGLRNQKAEMEQHLEKVVKQFKLDVKEAKVFRKIKRMGADEFTLKQLDEESAIEQITFKKIKREMLSEIEYVSQKIAVFHDEIEQLKQFRKTKSNRLQFQLFEQYNFLNADGASKSLNDIFGETPSKVPPAGAGECAAPKLFQFAFQHNLKPVELLEFWWGSSPASMIRVQGNFYPSCKSKCEPILGHMLSATKHDKAMVTTKNADLNNLEILFQDAYLAAINKPHDVLSVPGKVAAISVAAILKELFPHAEQPMLVHRLDRATSGILLVALNHDMYVKLQQQFTNREVKKRYVALLTGTVDKKNGIIDLPIRVDLDNRPQQLVCYKHGLAAQTKFEIVGHEQGLSRVHFFPITGRTHQLRVHAAHKDGLNCPIYGDDLYGTKAKRLYLHATEISFVHPVYEHKVTVYSEVPF